MLGGAPKGYEVLSEYGPRVLLDGFPPSDKTRLPDGMRRPVSDGMRYAPKDRRAPGAMERKPAYEKE
jgi:hypothetical protein